MTELVLSGGGYHARGHTTHDWGRRDPQQQGPGIRPVELRSALTMFLLLSQLTVLRLTVAPNFLDVLDLNLYRSITDGLPALEQLNSGSCRIFGG
jgi:hypothetical protein